MAKKTFGKGSVADLIRAAEEAQEAQKKQSSEHPVERALSGGSIADLVRAEKILKSQEDLGAANDEAGRSELQQAAALEPQQAVDKSGDSKPALGQDAHSEDTQAPELANAAPGRVGTGDFFSAERILGKEHKYKNASRQVTIAEEFYNFLRVLSSQYDITVAQMINNMLRPYFTEERFKKEMKLLVQKKVKESVRKIDEL
jgi:hypothetical protein